MFEGSRVEKVISFIGCTCWNFYNIFVHILLLVNTDFQFLLLARYVPNDDRLLFLEDPSWKNFKQPYLHNGAR